MDDATSIITHQQAPGGVVVQEGPDQFTVLPEVDDLVGGDVLEHYLLQVRDTSPDDRLGVR